MIINIIISLIAFFSVKKAPISETVTFPMNRYLFTLPGSPYPYLDSCLLEQIDISGFTNVMDFGAVGNGTTRDDDAIEDAFNAATIGVIFPAGYTYLVSKRSIIDLPANRNLVIWAYGATIKMDNLRWYTWLSLEYPSGSFGGEIIWLGGTMNGNKNNQSWPGSPLTENQEFVEDHGRFLGTQWSRFTLFKDITLIDLVMDGVATTNAYINVISNCTGSDAAVFTYQEVQEQGTYFKCRVVNGMAGNAFYVMNCTAIGGVIGIHYSTPESQIANQFNTVAVVRDCRLIGQRMNPMHWEDTWNVFVYRVYADGVGGTIRQTNETRLASYRNCEFRDRQMRFNQASNMRLAIIDNCSFSNSQPTLESMLQGLNANRPGIVTNTSFTGQCAAQQAEIGKFFKCTFTNFGALGTFATVTGTASTFTNGNRPSSTFNNGFIFNNTYINVTNSTGYRTPSDNNWQDVFQSYIDVYSDAGRPLGRIQPTTIFSP